MNTQKNSFLVCTKDGIVTNISNSYIIQPTVMFGNGSIKWYEDKMKKSTRKENDYDRKNK